jgi:hypothetical protein
MRFHGALVTTAVLLVLAPGCASFPARAGEATPAPSSTSVLRAEWLQKVPGLTALDALHTLPAYAGRTMRQPAPRFILVLDGTRTSNLDLLKGIQASDLFELRVVGESQSIGEPGEVEIVVTTLARARIS